MVFDALILLVFEGAFFWELNSAGSRAVCTPEYRDLVARTPELVPDWKASQYFYVPAVVFGLWLVFVVLAAM